MPEGRRAERRPTLERQRHAERGERRLERDANRVQRRADHRDLVRGDPGTDRAQRLLGHELERPAGSRSFEEADGTVERRALRRRCEQLALDVRQRRRQVLGGARRQIDDVVSGERRQIHGRAREGGVDGAARLVRQRDMDVGARRERLEEAPLGAGEVLEAVREHRAVPPRPEVAGQPLDAPSTEHPAIPCIEPVELGRGRRGRTMREARRGRRRRGARRRAPPVPVRGRRHTRGTARPASPGRHRRPAERPPRAPLRPPAAGRARRHARAPRRASRTCRSCPRAALPRAERARARPARRRRGSGRSARDRGRSRRRNGREAPRPFRHAPDRRRERDPPVHGSRAGFPPSLTGRTGNPLRAGNRRGCAGDPCRA